MYQRKTTDIYVLMSNYGEGWITEDWEYTKEDINKRKKDYSMNTNGSFKVKKRRIKTEELKTFNICK